MTALRLSYDLLNIAPLLYFVTMTLGVLYWVRKGRSLYLAIPIVAGIALLLHTTALGIRWYEGGLYRPPWTNLYESLVFFSWGLALVTWIVELKFKIRMLGLFGYALVFAGLGMAFLTPDKGINPLVPSLQSWWILAHSCLASFAYSGLVVASLFSFLYLVKVGLSPRTLGLSASWLGVFAILLTGGAQLILTGTYSLNEMVLVEGQWVKNAIAGSDPLAIYQVVLPLVGPALIVAFILYLLAGVGYIWVRRSFITWPLRVLTAGIILHVLTIAWIIIEIGARVTLFLGSNPYHLAFITVFAAIQFFLLFLVYSPSGLAHRLPEAARLDRYANNLTLFGFPFMTLILITGAIWAHEAWGRYWGWDPKETTALMTWLIYAAYIHARRTRGWAGRKAAAISVLGFFSVLFTYLGANLVLSGLHSYGGQ